MQISNHIIVDFLSKGENHLNFNNSFLEAFSEIDSKFHVLGIESHVKKLKPKSEGSIHSIKDRNNWILEVTLLFFSLLSKRENNITFLAFENYFLPTFLILFFPCFSGRNINLILHNNIAAVKKNYFKRIPLLICSTIFNMKFISLSKIGAKTMREIGFQNTEFIPHMNFKHTYDNKLESPVKFFEDTTNIVLMGRQAALFIEHVLPKINISEFENIRFYVFKNTEIKSNFNNLKLVRKRLTNKEFSAVLSSADFCFFPNINIGLRPSGVLLDAISSHCPIIAPNDGHFNEFSEYDIGFFYINNSSLNQTLSLINEKKMKRKNYIKSVFDQPLRKTSIVEFKKQLISFYEK